MDALGPQLVDLRGEGLAQSLEADDHVGDHLRFAVRADPDRGDPGQKLGIAPDIGDEIEHLFARIGHAAGFRVARHQPLASFASRAARIFAKSSPA